MYLPLSSFQDMKMYPPLSSFQDMKMYPPLVISRKENVVIFFNLGGKNKYLRNQYISEMYVLLLLNRAFDKNMSYFSCVSVYYHSFSLKFRDV
jgi:hypothetical protein